MALALNAQSISKTFVARKLFSGISLTIDDRERLALIGPNGSGKSTLLKILAGISDADSGTITTRRNLRVAYVAQNDAFPEGATVLSAITSALSLARLPHLHDDHEIELAAQLTLGRVGFGEFDQLASSLSGGQRKRLSIARELAKEPDLVLLDEPTNHLDIDGVEWLEAMLRSATFSSVVVTHDRAFLESVATRIVELSPAYPDGTFSVSGNYTEFLERKEAFLEAQAKQEQALAGLVREDLRWLSRGAQARRTKSKSRAASAYDRIDELEVIKARNAPARAAAIDFASTDRKTQKLLWARGLCKRYGDRQLFADLEILLSPGLKLGLMGPNGSGKSTLIKILTGEIEPDAPSEASLAEAAKHEHEMPHGTPPLGTIRRAPALRTVVFSQHRTELDPNQTLASALSPVDAINYRGRTMHIVGWAQRFLFTRDQLEGPIRTLSGGEQARVHIARLMLEPADILILDEPTNDLDIPSLEVLEDSLEDFPGAIVLVTHDRAMLGDLATQILALDGAGGANYYADYEQWKKFNGKQPATRASQTGAKESGNGTSSNGSGNAAATVTATKKKLSYKEQQELSQIEPAIEKAEALAKKLEAAMNDPSVIADHREYADVCRKLGEAQTQVASLYDRWAELDAKR